MSLLYGLISVPGSLNFVKYYCLCLIYMNPVQLKQKISSATSAIKSVFGQEENRQDAVSINVQDLCNIPERNKPNNN